MKEVKNIAYIDGQNLYFGTREAKWAIDHKKLRTYLKEKYHVVEAYYFMGFVSPDQQDLYDNLQKAGYILTFREHSSALKGNKKGNVDSDIIFGLMRKLVEQEEFNKVFILSGDGDYIRLVDFLIRKEKFGKMLFPNNKFASSLYKKLGGEYFSSLEEKGVKSKIEYTHHK